MWTQNGLKWISVLVAYNWAGTASARQVVTASGATSYIMNQYSSNNTASIYSETTNTKTDITTETSTSTYYFGHPTLMVGSDDTTESLDDYKLGSCITTLTATVDNYTQSGTGIFTISKSFANNTSDSITVKEIGLYVGTYYSNGATNPVLIARKVLDTPVTIPAGETKVVALQLDFNKLNS